MLLTRDRLETIDYWKLNGNDVSCDVVVIYWKGKIWPFNKSKFKFRRSFSRDGDIGTYSARTEFVSLYQQLTAWSEFTIERENEKQKKDDESIDGNDKNE